MDATEKFYLVMMILFSLVGGILGWTIATRSAELRPVDKEGCIRIFDDFIGIRKDCLEPQKMKVSVQWSENNTEWVDVK